MTTSPAKGSFPARAPGMSYRDVLDGDRTRAPETFFWQSPLLDGPSEAAERVQHQLGVRRRVFHQKHAQRVAHGEVFPAGGDSLRRSQNKPRVRAALTNSAKSTGLRT